MALRLMYNRLDAFQAEARELEIWPYPSCAGVIAGHDDAEYECWWRDRVCTIDEYVWLVMKTVEYWPVGDGG
jgi:hypothetical protein